MGDQTADLLPGTLDLLILQALSLKPLHGYGVLLRIGQISKGALHIPQGSLYPALYRLEHQGLITAEWGASENNRKAKYYTLTAAGRRRLKEETASWHRLVAAITSALNTTPDEV
ncbi:MAG: PadR family transcriptional regulator [Acidobacteria bacterium]|nr:MAG: PadR family transcriptional regulator [Acidobacteriota bacterium]PYR51875.1 MAG: PadR family transcriptional regulator [Acidobacteriota bacterium]